MTAKEIVANHNDITLTPAANTSKNEFCKLWPPAKQALELLQSMVKNPIAKAAIGIVIAAGDAISKSIGCTVN